jgi:hypothetical protein
MPESQNRRERARDCHDLLADVDRAGGRVPVEESKRLGVLRGFERSRSLNGLAGGVSPSIASEGEMRVLTEAGRRRARGR